MRAKVNVKNRPSWLQESDEYPHTVETIPLWTENYMTYLYDPAAGIAVCFHLCHRSDKPSLWEEICVISLPNDQHLVAKNFNVGREERGVSLGGVSFICEEPFLKWTKRFRGAARLVSSNELRAGPLTDGLHVPVDLELKAAAFGPPYDFGAKKLKTTWGHGHYEQALALSGQLSFGGKTIKLKGTGHRDHSWGARDYRTLGGRTAWGHGQFPSGRWFGFVNAPGLPPAEPMVHAVAGDSGQANKVEISGYPAANSFVQAEKDFEMKLTDANGISTVHAKILTSWVWCFTSDAPGGVISQSSERPGPPELCMGNHAAPVANHYVVEAFARYDWKGETGYGLVERTVFLL